METVLRFYFAFSLLAVFLSVTSCVILWKHRHSGLGRVSFLLMLAITLWLVPYVLILLVDDLNTSVLFFKVGYIGALSLPVTWLMYAFVMVGKESWLTPKRIIPLVIIAGLFLFLIATDQFWTNTSLIRLEWLSTLEVKFSDWLIPYLFFTYTLDGLGILLILWSVVRSPRKYLWRGLVIVIGALFPILANMDFFFGLIPELGLDLTPFSTLFPVLIIIWGNFRYQWFDVVPVAREALVDRVADGMAVLDVTGRVLDLNLAARHILGKTLYQARLKPLTELLPEMSPLLNQVAGIAVSKNEVTVQHGGQVKDYEVVMNPIVDRGGNPAGTLVMLHDITERKLAEKQLREALEKEKALAEARARFVAVASHAFRTPLTTIKSSADMLDTYSNRWSEEKRNEHLARIRQSISEMIYLLKRMLAYEQLQSGKIQFNAGEVDLVELCERVVRELPIDSQARAGLKFEKHGETFKAIQDETLLYQVLTNLLSNAYKFSTPGSLIWLELWVERADARIEVRDQGRGIPAQDLPHLGEAFFRGSNTNNTPGSGLGLLIVNRALQMIGGKLQVEPNGQGGTVMRVTFPLRLKVEPLV